MLDNGLKMINLWL